ncbi:MAG TPA: ATP-binding protein [Solirubrobacterales bacterium]|nr:ATP-binding protein [Solirubrobacterales bacterium]
MAGRDQPMRRFGAMLRAAPEQPANMRLTGLRGVGKTVLLGEFQQIAEENGWASAVLEFQPGHNREDSMVSALFNIAQESKARLSRIERIKKAVGGAVRSAGTLGVGWNEFQVTYDPIAEQRQEDLTKALFEVVEMAVEKGRTGFVLLLDEAQVVRDETKRAGEHPLSLLISSIVALQRREIPLGLVLCGLPTLTGNLLKARSYTERMFRGEEIGSLEEREAREAFEQPLAESDSEVSAEADLVSRVIDEVEGYPYFIQLWGAEIWETAEIAGVIHLTNDLLDAARPDIYRRLDLDFYNPRVETLTPAEQDVLLGTAGAEYPPLVVSKLNDAINKAPANVNVLLGRLVEAGVLYRLRKGEYDYTAPRFRDYLLRRTQASRVEAAGKQSSPSIEEPLF